MSDKGSKLASSAELHDEFLNNISDFTQDTNESSDKHSSSVRLTPRIRSGESKNRFRHNDFKEGDMYSAKPVWQQLNELESAWNINFRHKGRLQSQKAISKAKKCVESLDAIEAQQSRLLNIDSFREVFGDSRSPPPLSADQEGDDAGLSPKKDALSTRASDGAKSSNVIVGMNTGSADNSDRWMSKNHGVKSLCDEECMIDDMNLPGDQYYQAAPLNNLEESSKGVELRPEEEALRASVSPSAFFGRQLKEDERQVIEGIFGNRSNDTIDAATPSAVIAATSRIEPETWLNMDPAHILLQQTLLKCKSSSQLLFAISDKVEKMNHVNVSTALHRMARYSNPQTRYTLNNNDTFVSLVSSIERHIPFFDCQGLTNVFWSVVRLRIQPRWLDCLLDALYKNASDLSPSELASSLFAVSKVTVKNSSSVDLRDRLIGLAQERVSQFTRPLDITCVATALARLNVRNPVLFGRISNAVISHMNDFSMQHICGIAWAFASLGFTDRVLFTKIRQFIEENANASSLRDVIHLAWALSKVREADNEVFLFTISPFVRSHIGHLTCRDISTVAWAFVNAEIDDPDLFEDLASALLHRVDEMTSHDIAAAVAAFSHMEESHKALFKKMRNRAFAICDQFTPLQLGKITRGFSSVGDERFYGQLGRAIESKVHLMLPENIVEVLMGLTEAGHVAPSLYKKLLEAVSVSARQLYAEDSLLLLQVVTKLKRDSYDGGMTSALHKLSHSLVDQIEKRVKRWRCYNIVHISSFFECLSLMGIGSSKGDSTVKVLARQLAACLNRLRSSNSAPSLSNGTFANFIRACAYLPPRKLALVQAELSKNTQLMKAMHTCVASLRAGSFLTSGDSPLSSIDAAFCLIRMGYFDDGVVALCDEIVSEASANKAIELTSSNGMDTLSKVIWFLTECNLHLSWVRGKLREVGDSTTTFEASDALVRFMWACVILGEDVLLMRMVTRFVPLFTKLPEDMLLAQQVALHVLLCSPDRPVDGKLLMTTNPLVNNSADSCDIPPAVYDTLREWLEYQRDDLYTVSPGSKNKRALELDYDSVLSESLIAMKIPHKTVHTIQNMYRVSVSFPLENHVVDVLNFTDCFVPNGQIRSRAMLRQRQLQLLGYGVVSLKLDRLYDASREKRTKELIAEAIGGFCAPAMDYLPLNPQ
ncbi:hypothetical protein X943_002290 [Babesia divergens]|uniref:RNA-editing substrate-binding complex 6 protein domain-containing protein n=1 Tax=Babesia divergens TaxID=32595 RepID=A0AAD9LE94_BABDI|nr:hypothetical protein X943_002290 [Babesia divergens]